MAATGSAEPVEDSDAVAQKAVDEAAAQEAERAANSTAQPTEDEQAADDVPDAETTWAFPAGAGSEPRTGSTAASVSSEGETSSESTDDTEQASQDHMTWGWSQPAGQPGTQPQADTGQYAQQPSAQQPQPGYQQVGYGQAYAQHQQFGQQRQAAQQRGASRIDLDSARTWGLFVAGGAAFLSLFGFIFTPTLDTTIAVCLAFDCRRLDHCPAVHRHGCPVTVATVETVTLDEFLFRHRESGGRVYHDRSGPDAHRVLHDALHRLFGAVAIVHVAGAHSRHTDLFGAQIIGCQRGKPIEPAAGLPATALWAAARLRPTTAPRISAELPWDTTAVRGLFTGWIPAITPVSGVCVSR